MGERTWRVDATRVVSEVLDGEAVIVDMASGHYHAAPGVAATVWQALEAGHTLDAITELVNRRHTGVPDGAALDISRFIDSLVEAGLVNEADGPAPSDPDAGDSVAAGDPTPWSPPALESHDDLEDLLLLDPVHDVSDQGWPHAAPAAD